MAEKKKERKKSFLKLNFFENNILWKNFKDSTKSYHIPYTQFPLLFTLSISIVLLSRLMRFYFISMHFVLTKVHNLFKFSWDLPNIYFLFQNPAQDTTIVLFIISPQVL